MVSGIERHVLVSGIGRHILVSGIAVSMPLVHRLTRSGRGPVIAAICTRGDSLVGLPQLCAALAAIIDTEEDSEQD